MSFTSRLSTCVVLLCLFVAGCAGGGAYESADRQNEAADESSTAVTSPKPSLVTKPAGLVGTEVAELTCEDIPKVDELAAAETVNQSVDELVICPFVQDSPRSDVGRVEVSPSSAEGRDLLRELRRPTDRSGGECTAEFRERVTIYAVTELHKLQLVVPQDECGFAPSEFLDAVAAARELE